MKSTTTHQNSSIGKEARRGLARWFSRWLFRSRHRPADIPPTIPVVGIHRILICRSAKTLGEILLLTPLLSEIAARYPGAEVDFITGCGVAESLVGSYFQTRTIFTLPGRIARQPLRFLRILRRMHAVHYDLVIDPYLLSHSDRLLLNLARARYRLGFDGPRKSGHLTHAIPEPARLQHAGKLPVFLLRTAMGDPTDPTQWEYPSLDIRLAAGEREQGNAALTAMLKARQATGRRGVIGVYAYATGAKRFDQAWWYRFLPLIEARYPDHAILEIVPMFAESLLDNRYPTYYSSDVRKLAAVLSSLALFVSADCGVMHLACASGTATVGIFSVTDIPGWSVYGPGCRTIDARNRTAGQVAEEIIAAYGDLANLPKLVP
jgi:heptosyltransferase-3